MKRKIIVVIPTLLLAAACFKPKNQEKLEGKNLTALQDLVLGEMVMSDGQKQSGATGQSLQDSLGKSFQQIMSGCATLTITPWDTITWPKTATVDFGPVNCLGSDGHLRRGKIIYTFSYWFRQPGTIITATFDNFFLNDHQITGTITAVNQGRNAQNHLVYSYDYPNGLIYKPNNGGVVQWQSQREYEWIEGEASWLPHDDVWLVRGTANGISSEGVPFVFETLEDLNIKWGCRWVRSGKLKLTIQDIPDIIINYGTVPACDAYAVVTFLGTDYTITLP